MWLYLINKSHPWNINQVQIHPKELVHWQSFQETVKKKKKILEIRDSRGGAPDCFFCNDLVIGL